jgi:AcrR family transcriptional regulator
VEATRVRRTQAMRTEETRAALLDATIELLGEVGYAALTTREVAARAGVSRGAQTHHFPTKADLVVAGVERLFDQQATAFRAAFDALPPSERDLGAAVGLLWEIVRGPTYAAVLEVVVAARTDDSLRVVVHALSATFERTLSGLLADVFAGFATDDALVGPLVDVAFAIVQGAAVSSYAGFGDPERTVRLAQAVAGLITPSSTELVRSALGALGPPARPTPDQPKEPA